MVEDPQPAPPQDPYPRTVLPPAEMAGATDRATFTAKRARAAEEKAAATARGEEKPRSKIAVFAAHGMGQQIPFQTMDDIACGLLKAANAPGSTEIRTRTVKLKSPSGNPEKDLNTQRIELEIDDAQGNPVEVHVYEGYWASLTEGRVTARDVVFFLLGAAWNGIRKGEKPFQRWLFGRMKEPAKSPHTLRHLITVLLVFLSLLLFNVVIGAVALGRYLKVAPAGQTPWPSEPLLAAMTTVIAWFCVAALIYGALLLISIWRKPKPPESPGQNKRWVGFNNFLWRLFFVLLFLTIAAGVVVLVLIGWDRISPLPAWKCEWPMVCSRWWPFIWVLLFAISWGVRLFLIQFIGDVAAYVTPHKLDRFYEMRAQIRQWVLNIAQAIYSEPSYERIGIIGHSLGSVVVYDVLNRLMLDDYLNGGTLDVVGRTRVLVTFGSPLDKAAYLFGLQGHQTTDTREALAASLQPLICDYKLFRTRLRWINVYSPHDIFAGSLDFYDDVDNPDYKPGMEVDNQEDEDAVIPVVAHTEYWKATKIYSEFYQRL
jgi:hypothetical protein